MKDVINKASEFALLAEALLASWKYIDETPCDYDIFPKQYEAYKKYKELRDKIEAQIIRIKDE